MHYDYIINFYGSKKSEKYAILPSETDRVYFSKHTEKPIWFEP